MNFNGKVVLVTGAGSGIGADTARHFASLSATLVLVDCDELKLTETANDCGKGVLAIRADLTLDENLSRMIQQVIDTFGRLDVLLNIAGIAVVGGIQSMPIAEYDKVMSVNLRAVYHLTMLCVPHLMRSKGCVVNVSSACSKVVMPNVLAYSLSKVGIDHLTKSLAVELGPVGVRVNAVNPGLILTPLARNVAGNNLDSMVTTHVSKTPLGRVGTTMEVARAMAFLASDEMASYITGVTLPVDGGFAVSGNN